MTNKHDPHKCEVLGNRVRPCTTLSNAVEDMYTRTSKGIFDLMATISVGYCSKGFGVKSGQFKKKGIMFNYCPFCGTPIGEQEVLGDE